MAARGDPPKTSGYGAHQRLYRLIALPLAVVLAVGMSVGLLGFDGTKAAFGAR